MIDISTGKQMTRRNVLSGLGGIIAAGCAPSIALGAARIVSRDALAGSANASVGGMMRNVGARNAAMFGGGWKNPYITDGLVAMWDGEWNAGPGVHDSSATEWKDLTNGKMLAYTTNAFVFADKSYTGEFHDYYTYQNISFGSDYADFDKNRNSVVIGPAVDMRNWTGLTMELVFKEIPASSKVAGIGWSYAGAPFRPMFYGSSFYYTGNSTASFGGITRAMSVACDIGNPGYSDSIDCTTFSEGNQISHGAYSIEIDVGTRLRTPNFLRVGAYGSGYNTNSGFYSYKISSLRIYNRAISSSEIAANYAIDKARFNLP